MFQTAASARFIVFLTLSMFISDVTGDAITVERNIPKSHINIFGISKICFAIAGRL